jgi:hypothetical protein
MRMMVQMETFLCWLRVGVKTWAFELASLLRIFVGIDAMIHITGWIDFRKVGANCLNSI